MNLENKEILSDLILNVMDSILNTDPLIVFGGSIGLNAMGVLNRRINDIDLFVPLNYSLVDFCKLGEECEITSDTVTDISGVEISRTGLKIRSVKICCFKVPNEELQSQKIKFYRNKKSYCICVQNVNYAIQAKNTYASRNPKHLTDLEEINNNLNNLTNVGNI